MTSNGKVASQPFTPASAPAKRSTDQESVFISFSISSIRDEWSMWYDSSDLDLDDLREKWRHVASYCLYAVSQGASTNSSIGVIDAYCRKVCSIADITERSR